MPTTKKWMTIPLTIVVLGGIVAGMINWLHTQGPGKRPPFLPGVYICVAENEFCRIDDTLVIRRTRTEEDHYTVMRTTSFIRIRSGKKAPPEYEQAHWDGQYHANKSRLISANEADTVWYYPDDNKVSKASFYYEKIE
ncbi:MAG: hypothetical protein J0H74_28760 [Chitinophagaceae bacterium]|nr:hypothetical protein [Chitinophagaceae bacterium]